MSHHRTLKIHRRDNIIVALTDLSKGDIVELDDVSFTLVSDVKAKHKFALRNFTVDEEILMYGVVVRKAKNKITVFAINRCFKAFNLSFYTTNIHIIFIILNNIEFI